MSHWSGHVILIFVLNNSYFMSEIQSNFLSGIRRDCCQFFHNYNHFFSCVESRDYDLIAFAISVD